MDTKAPGGQGDGEVEAVPVVGRLVVGRPRRKSSQNKTYLPLREVDIEEDNSDVDEDDTYNNTPRRKSSKNGRADGSSKSGRGKRKRLSIDKDKIYNQPPIKGTYAALDHSKPNPLPSSASNYENVPKTKNDLLTVMMGPDTTDSLGVDLSCFSSNKLGLSKEDIKSISNKIAAKIAGVPAQAWDTSHDNFEICMHCNSGAPATTTPAGESLGAGMHKNDYCNECAAESSKVMLERPCGLACRREVRKGAATCDGCKKDKVCVNFQECGGANRYTTIGGTISNKCEKCYNAWKALQKCTKCEVVGKNVSGRSYCDKCKKKEEHSEYARSKKYLSERARERAKGKAQREASGEGCKRCNKPFVEGGEDYYYYASGAGAIGCLRDNCILKCRVILAIGEDGENVLCDRLRKVKTWKNDQPSKYFPRCKECGGKKAKDPNETLAGK